MPKHKIPRFKIKHKLLSHFSYRASLDCSFSTDEIIQPGLEPEEVDLEQHHLSGVQRDETHECMRPYYLKDENYSGIQPNPEVSSGPSYEERRSFTVSPVSQIRPFPFPVLPAVEYTSRHYKLPCDDSREMEDDFTEMPQQSGKRSSPSSSDSSRIYNRQRPAHWISRWRMIKPWKQAKKSSSKPP